MARLASLRGAACHDLAIREVAAVLAEGGIAAIPTETVYGLCADLRRPEAIARLRTVKGRSAEAPFALLLPAAGEVAAWGRVPEEAAELVAELLPGGLTLVLESLRQGTEALGSASTVGIRVPDHAPTRALLESLGGPIAATSANRAGSPPLADAAAVLRELGEEVDIVLEGGPAPTGMASTVLDLSARPYVLLREGPVSRETIEGYLRSTLVARR